jgi:hypothetical protein
MDRTRLGLVFGQGNSPKTASDLSASNEPSRFLPGDPNFKVDASFEVMNEVQLVGVHPHMHTRQGFRISFGVSQG